MKPHTYASAHELSGGDAQPYGSPNAYPAPPQPLPYPGSTSYQQSLRYPSNTSYQEPLPYPSSTPYQQPPSFNAGVGPPPAPTASADYGPGGSSSFANEQTPAPAADAYWSRPRKDAGDPLAQVLVQDGEDPQPFTSAKALASYINLFPEAENDQACRVFKYGPRCPPGLLMPLFKHFDFPRYSLFPYGFANDFSSPDPWKAGLCKCDRCSKSEPCGQHALFKNFRFYLHTETTVATSPSARVSTLDNLIAMSNGSTEYHFHRSDWNFQLFRFRSRRVETTEYAFDALVYQDYDSPTKLRSSPLDYVFAQLDLMLTHWDVLLNASVEFLSSFRLEVLEERLERDRSIIRNLLVAAQHWEEFRRMLQAQVRSLDFLEYVAYDRRWMEGRDDDFFAIKAAAAGYQQRFRAVEFQITSELQLETDTLINRVSNLITIDEGYRSRDQNASIWRLTWVTVVFLPLVFTAGLFGMNVDLFGSFPSWSYYIYTSLIVIFLMVFVYAIFRSRRRFLHFLRLSAGLVILPLVGTLRWFLSRMAKKDSPESGKDPLLSLDDLEKNTKPTLHDNATVLKWAACSGRTDVVRRILNDLSAGNASQKLNPWMSGQALIMAAQNGHVEAATLLLEAGEGLSYTDEKDATALHHAAKSGLSTVVKMLIERGADQEARDQDGKTALDYAMESNNEPTIDVLLKRGKNMNKQGTADLRSLHFSARTGDLETLKTLHKSGSSLESRDGKGQTVLFHAVKGKQHTIITWLLENAANVQAVDKDGLTPLHVAAQCSDPKAAEILLDKNANVDARSVQHLTPLLCIPGASGIAVLKLLHARGADVNATDKSFRRLAHTTAAQGDAGLPLLQVLRDLDADLSVSGDRGRTPAHLAAEAGSVRALQLLAGAGLGLGAAQAPGAQIGDGQPQAPPASTYVAPAPVSVAPEGQPQATVPATSAAPAPVSVAPEGQPQATVPATSAAPAPVSVAPEGQPQATVPATSAAPAPVSVAPEGQPQATVPATSVAPVSEATEGQPQATVPATTVPLVTASTGAPVPAGNSTLFTSPAPTAASSAAPIATASQAAAAMFQWSAQVAGVAGIAAFAALI